jgi:two-component system CheB/CheR fusion protein
VRELCTFSSHSLTRDPPFSRINLLSCRNLLIYLDIDLQAVVIPAFHYSLVPSGILLLGSAETISRHEGLFSTLDRSHRIFQKLDVPTPPLHMTGRATTREAPTGKAGTTSRPSHSK